MGGSAGVSGAITAGLTTIFGSMGTLVGLECDKLSSELVKMNEDTDLCE